MSLPIPQPGDRREWIAEAKRQLGIDRLILQIHDASFPSLPQEEMGRGSPYSLGAEQFFTFAAELGFDAIQLGPQGMTDRGNPSPYDGTLFSRNPLNLPLARMAEQGRLLPTAWRSLQSAASGAAVPQIHDAFQRAIAELVQSASASDRAATQEFLSTHEAWLVPDALYQCLCQLYQAGWWGEWESHSQGAFDQRLFQPPAGKANVANRRLAELRTQFHRQIEDYALIQWLLAEEHRQLRERLAGLGLKLYADLQVGLAPQDVWSHRGLFLGGYRLGAPPSRTNPDGQPWGYYVLDPAQWGSWEQPGAALQFVRARLDKVLSECDGVRVDHPHGWVDPWVYRSDASDPMHAVQNGTRLYSSPDEPGHPALHGFAIARPDQIDRSQAPYADNRVRDLDDAQVARYALLVDTILECTAGRGQLAGPVACEVLSTLPYPVRRVLERHHLGRFRVIQKARLDDAADVYRIEQAEPQDWIMLGTHDTATVWELARDWCRSSQAASWAAYLAPQLAPESERSTVAQRLAREPGELVHGMFTALLASRARQVSVFFPDLLGMVDRYNRPGVVDSENWTLRVPSDFGKLYELRRTRGEAIDIGRCLSDALAARRNVVA